MFKSAVFLLVVFAVILKANSLQCHVCYDCEKLSDDYLTSCDSLLSTTTTSSTAQPTSTSTSTSTTPSSTITRLRAHLRCLSHYVCVCIPSIVNGSDVIVRGCAAGHTNETCYMFGLTSCSFCSTDKCNAAGSIQASAAVLAVAFFASYNYVHDNDRNFYYDRTNTYFHRIHNFNSTILNSCGEICDCLTHQRSKRYTLRGLGLSKEAVKYVCFVDKYKINETEIVKRGCAIKEADEKTLCTKLGLGGSSVLSCALHFFAKMEGAEIFMCGFLLVFLAIGNSGALQCFVCQNCKEVTRDHIQTCKPPSPFTTVPTVTEPQTTTEAATTSVATTSTTQPSTSTTEASTTTSMASTTATEPTTTITEPTTATTKATTVTTVPITTTTEATTTTTKPTTTTTETTTTTTEPTTTSTEPTTITMEPTTATTEPTTTTTAPIITTTTEAITTTTEPTTTSTTTKATTTTIQASTTTTEATTTTAEPTTTTITTEATTSTTEPTTTKATTTTITAEPTTTTTEATTIIFEPTTVTTEATTTSEATNTTVEPTTTTAKAITTTTVPTLTTEATTTSEAKTSTSEATIPTNEPISNTAEATAITTEFKTTAAETYTSTYEPMTTTSEATITTKAITTPRQQASDHAGSLSVKNRFYRSIKQNREDDEQVRCVVTSYKEAGITFYLFTENGEENVVRGCSYEPANTTARCHETIGRDDVDLVRCSVCDGDLCNSAAAAAVTFVPLILGLLMNL
ncbi:mucin-2-like [Cydia strobilella]|uniref:mucin-2-like n=1 Tax=Cydia strobilella TaxID=1100964 RepID=UPI003005EECF